MGAQGARVHKLDVHEVLDVHNVLKPNPREVEKQGALLLATALHGLSHRDSRRWSVVDGFRIEMTSDELIQHLEARIQHHRRAATECETKRIRFEAVGNLPEEEDGEMPLLAAWPGYGIELERRVDGHKRKETTLTFLRDHVIAREIYRLGEDDLRLLELWPRRALLDTDS